MSDPGTEAFEEAVRQARLAREQELARRIEEIGHKVREHQAQTAQAGPLPSFLNVMTAMMAEFSMRLEDLEADRRQSPLKVTRHG